MRITVILALLLLGTALGADQTYEGEWGVYQGCDDECCCPSRGSTVSIEKTGTDETTMKVIAGSWKGCEKYGWDNSHSHVMPFDDSTSIPDDGVQQDYTDKNGNTISWSYKLSMTSAKVDTEGIKKGDPIIIIVSEQGGTEDCRFVLGESFLQIGIALLAIISLLFV